MKIYSPGPKLITKAPSPRTRALTLWKGKTIGLYAHFKAHSPVMLQVVADLLHERFHHKIQEHTDQGGHRGGGQSLEFDAELKVART